MKNWIIVATFFCLWLSTTFPDFIQSYMAYSLILTFGVLHGANDITLIVKSKKERPDKQVFKKILLYYIVTVLVILGVFVLYPPLALLLFILFSGYHFGEQHFGSKMKNSGIGPSVMYTSYGLVILFMIFLIRVNEVTIIIEEVSALILSKQLFTSILAVSAIIFIGSLFFFWYTKQLNVKVYEELFYILIFYIIFNTASLIWGFCIYFILWHSIPSLVDQMKYLYGDSSKSTLITYLKSSWVYWLVSVLGLGLLFLFFGNDHQFFISILLYFLAAITFPHVIVMSRLKHD
ncbi:MAG: Brp/Blh family beta-carotene 15,15'-dioxygenase [Maribacter sp.]|nr:Brp/Blh family beta-carotene 15,15'-dioxygenase [Maribacter sp.]NNK19453.1 beta-carotene 15,15'-dioxygenase, Brp/Blh family [Maribacter sp.]